MNGEHIEEGMEEVEEGETLDLNLLHRVVMSAREKARIKRKELRALLLEEEHDALKAFCTKYGLSMTGIVSELIRGLLEADMELSEDE